MLKTDPTILFIESNYLKMRPYVKIDANIAVFSILDGTALISDDQHYKKHMEFTSKLMARMAEIGGPRCCKRNAFLAIIMGAEYIKERYGIPMPLGDIKCEFSSWNKQCIGSRCPFHQ